MSRRLRVGVAALLFAVCLGVAAEAPAAGWPWPIGCSVLLAFGASWSDAGGRVCTHRGIDIGGGAGAEVRSCTGGTVAFSGMVPSSAGGTVAAVTVRTPDGLSVTYMPLERGSVAQGSDVAAGQVVGTLAATGDGSHPDTHLHLSVKRGELAIDPMTLLAGTCAPIPAECPVPQGPAPPVSGSPVLAGAPTSAGAAAPQGVASSQSAPQPTSQASVAPQTAAEAAGVRIPATLPESDARAVHTLDASRSWRWSPPTIRVPALPSSVASVALQVVVGAVSAIALLLRARRLAAPASLDVSRRSR